ncbi:MarR family winged helix-turn-helix transcriptional regulator [Konateibacter massiliensis]|uniref:MarR family winged helix-turn-helix transcriptional regulator n=1 Tax=Konateibacter massiliensis TaxID=2002841 RepID=UPI000C152504|nr:helix-turn-helix domain-containing protein [Konateibacter massiliensis]
MHDKCEQKRISKVIIDLSYQLKRDLDAAAAKHGLTRMQAVVIKHLEEETQKGDVFQKDIEKEFRIRKSSVTSVLQLLEKNGYIVRESGKEDARLKKIVLTDKAKTANAMIGNTLERREEKLNQILSEEEKKYFFQVAEKIAETLEGN